MYMKRLNQLVLNKSSVTTQSTFDKAFPGLHDPVGFDLWHINPSMSLIS